MDIRLKAKMSLEEQQNFLLVVMSGVDDLDFDVPCEKLNPGSRPLVDSLERVEESVDQMRGQGETGEGSETRDGGAPRGYSVAAAKV